MIDIKDLRENPDKYRANMRKKGQDEKKVSFVLSLDEKWRSVKPRADSLRAERNKISEQINQAKKSGKDAKELIKRAREIPEKLKQLEEEEKETQGELQKAIYEIPNLMHAKVPEGRSALENPVIKKWGLPAKPKFKLLNHAELIENLGLADFEAGRENSGQGFNYLKSDIALLDLALQRYGIEFAMKNGFSPVVPPMMLRKEVMFGALNGLKDFENVVYKVEGEDLYLIGTAEHALVSMMKDKTISGDKLPLMFCAVTPCFRKEIGGHGVDTKGLFRMHQFNKVEQVAFSKPEGSWEMLEKMQKITEKFFQSLKIPYRVIEICAGDLGDKFARQYDIEAWFPRQQEYKEVTSAGNCTDFQARALNIRYNLGSENRFVHVLNNTMVATSRAMVAILENYQQKDGSIKIPSVLQKYMLGKKKIEAKKGKKK